MTYVMRSLAHFRQALLGLCLSSLPLLALAVANPQVTLVPVTVPLGDPSRDYPQFATQLNLQSRGYVEQEFFIQGAADRYLPADLATGSVISSGHPYKTRVIVRRPASASRFNGIVVVEWLNVTSLYNLDALWLTSYDELMRQGYAYVGVSAQRVGVHAPLSGLREWSPVRYGSLDVTAGGSILDDSLSYDIFSQATQAVLKPKGLSPLGTLRPRLVIATGASQSEEFLVRYHNSVQPLTQLFDGYLMYLGVGGKLRTDLKPKVFKVNTENDVLLLGEYGARQPDSNTLRTYEVAGTSHVGRAEPNLRGELLVRDNLPITDVSVCDKPALSAIPTAHVVNAAFNHLSRWISKGPMPPRAPLLQIIPGTPIRVARDERGNALGGIRLAQHAVPTATNTGLNSGPGFCFLLGSNEPFDAATLSSLYPSHGRYVLKVTQATLRNLGDGHIVAADALKTIATAARSNIGKR